MPLLPLQALRRSHRHEDGSEDVGRRRVTRSVALQPSEDVGSSQEKESTNRSRSQPAKLGDARHNAGRSPRSPTNLVLLQRSPVGLVAQTHAQRRQRIHFAPSPASSTEVTPYSKVYGVDPDYFDFDRHGAMQPTSLYKDCSIPFTPSNKGRFVFVVQGASPTSSSATASPNSSVNSATAQSKCQFVENEAVKVLTDDGKRWMDGKIMDVFPEDCEAEGFRIPGGTVRVAYELGFKWVIPQNIPTTIRKITPQQVAPQHFSPKQHVAATVYKRSPQHMPLPSPFCPTPGRPAVPSSFSMPPVAPFILPQAAVAHAPVSAARGTNYVQVHRVPPTLGAANTTRI